MAHLRATLHTNAYYEMVNQMLGAATTRAEADAVLGTIRTMLASGGM